MKEAEVDVIHTPSYRVKVSGIDGHQLERNRDFSVERQVGVSSAKLVVFVNVYEPELVEHVLVVQREVCEPVQRHKSQLNLSKAV